MTERRFSALRLVLGALGRPILVAILLLTMARAEAAGIPPVFVVAGVAVDTSAANAVAARAAALADGQRAGLRRLMERLTAPADWSRLPQPDADTVTGLVADFEVANERSSAVRYIASYTFRFNPNGVRRLLQAAGIPFTELASKPVVLVPLLKAADGARLWEDPNPWRDAWNAMPGKDGLVPWIVPAGDIADVQALDARGADSPRPEQIQTLSQRYGGGDVVVALAVPTENAIDITVTRYASDGAPDVATTRVAGAKLDPALYQAGVIAAQRELESAWKKTTLTADTGGERESELEVSVPVTKPADWAMLRGRLAKVAAILSTEPELITRAELRLKLRVKGDPALLKVALAQQDLALLPGSPYQILETRAAADATAPRSDP
jgi:hypothetical protein